MRRRYYYQHIVKQTGNTADTETDVAETEADIDQHEMIATATARIVSDFISLLDGGVDGLGGNRVSSHAKLSTNI